MFENDVLDLEGERSLRLRRQMLSSRLSTSEAGGEGDIGGEGEGGDGLGVGIGRRVCVGLQGGLVGRGLYAGVGVGGVGVGGGAEGDVSGVLDQATKHLEDIIARSENMCKLTTASNTIAYGVREYLSGGGEDVVEDGEVGGGGRGEDGGGERESLDDILQRLNFDEIYNSSRSLVDSFTDPAPDQPPSVPLFHSDTTPSIKSTDPPQRVSNTTGTRNARPLAHHPLRASRTAPSKPPHRHPLHRAAPPPVKPAPRHSQSSRDLLSQQTPLIQACFRKSVCDVDLLLMSGNDVNTLVSSSRYITYMYLPGLLFGKLVTILVNYSLCITYLYLPDLL